MSEFRIQKFTNPADLTVFGEGEQPPRVGWAIDPGGDVYHDRVPVGHAGKFRIGAVGQREPYGHIEYLHAEAGLSNALVNADRKHRNGGSDQSLRRAIRDALEHGMTAGQIAGDLMTTTERVTALAAE